MTIYPTTSRRDAQADWAGLFFFVACLFWISAQTETFKMPVEVYGEAVIAIPAELWAGVLLFANALHLFGLYINGRWRWSPLLRVVALLTHLTFSITFLTSAITAPVGDVVALFSVGFATWNGRYLWINLCDLRHSIGGRHGRGND